MKKSEIPKVILQQKEDWNAWLESVRDVEEKWFKRKLTPMVANRKKQIDEIWEKEFSPEKSVSSLKEFVTQFTIQGKVGFSPSDFLRTVKPKVAQLLKEKPRTKVKMNLVCIMSRTELKTGDEIQAEAVFHSQIEKNFEGTDHIQLVQKMNKRILENFSVYQRRGSNWRFERIVNLAIHFVKFRPLRAGTFMKLPKGLKNKKATVNIQNQDEKCFKYAVGRSLFPVKKNPQRITKELQKSARKRGEFALVKGRRKNTFLLHQKFEPPGFWASFRSKIKNSYLPKMHQSFSIRRKIGSSFGILRKF